MVRARVGEDGVALVDQCFGQELKKMTLEMDGFQLQFVVERLGGVESLHAEGLAAPKREGGSGGFGR